MDKKEEGLDGEIIQSYESINPDYGDMEEHYIEKGAPKNLIFECDPKKRHSFSAYAGNINDAKIRLYGVGE